MQLYQSTNKGQVLSLYNDITSDADDFDTKEFIELIGYLRSYYNKQTGKKSYDEEELSIFYHDLLNKTRTKSNFLMRVARTLERNSSDKTFMLTPDSIVGIGTEYNY